MRTSATVRLLLVVFAACEGPAEVRPEAGAPSAELPTDFAPSQLRLAEEHADLSVLLGDDVCLDCHRDEAEQHAASAHARSSFDNPWYRATVDRLREDVGFEASRHCAGCHDPVMLVAGAMDAPIEPDDPRTRVGVTCSVCHGIVETRSDGNASYTLSTAPIPIPDPNDEDEVAVHRARVAPSVLRTPGLCGSCHRGFLGTFTGNEGHLPGLDEAGPWRGSAWGGQHAQRLDDVPATECRGCHMSPEPRRREDGTPTAFVGASHRFAGGHSALAAATDDDVQLATIAARQSTAATIDVVGLVHEDGRRELLPERARLVGGERVTFDVVVRNVGVGHVFPGGARDLRDHRVVLEVRDANGTPLTRSDDFVLGTGVLDEEGALQREHFVHRFRALGWDHTIAPRDARAVRFALRLPDDVALPLTIDARLVARRHAPGVRTLGCEATRSERGRAFDDAVRAAGDVPIDACTEQPAIELARALVIGGRRQTRPTWSRLYDHALALSHSVSEHLDDARPSLERALRLAPDARTKAQVRLELARLEANLARPERALALADEVEREIGVHPAIDRVRGLAFEKVWRFADAAEAYARVAAAAPLDTQAHRDHARALGAAGRADEVPAAAAPGLRLQPRDEGLLRSVAVATDAPDALARYLAHRRPDDESTLRQRCDARDPRCARDRMPLPLFELLLLAPALHAPDPNETP
ncbi:MAG: hypothetical protein H6721_03455 [Sandaracinus sp.]|nr:hypothetical protein [Sandaracinus sp.]